MKENLTEEELNERIAILKRFKSLLEKQRTKFQEYLLVLEKQQKKIEEDDDEAISMHTDLENQIVANIQSLQKVIVPMQSLYEAASPSKSDSSIAQIQSDLDSLHKKVLLQNERNKQLLQTRITQIKVQLNTFNKNNPYRGRRSIYAERQTGNVVSIES